MASARTLLRPLLRAAARAQPLPIRTTPFLTHTRFLTSTLPRPSSSSGTFKYTPDHEYLFTPPSPSPPNPTLLTIGITTHAASSLGDIVYIELPPLSTHLTAGDPLGSVESVKSASEIISPVSGVVVEVNALLAERPGHLTVGNAEEVGVGGGWICRVQVEGGEEGEGGEVGGEGLMGGEEYERYKKGEGH